MAISKIKSSSLAGLPTSVITSGTFADARIAASNVSQHAVSFDDDKIVNDLSTLGLRVHTQENLNASNTNSASFDVFQDSSGITNLTNCSRDSDEFISSVASTTTSYNFKTAGTYGQPEMRSVNSTQSTSSHSHSNAWTNDRVSRASSSYSSAHSLFLHDLTQDFTIHHWNAQDSMSDGSGNTHNKNYQAFTGVIFHGDTITPGKNPSYNGSSIFRAAGATSGNYGHMSPSNYFDYVMTDAVQSAVSGDGFTDTNYAGESAQTVNATTSTNGHVIRHYYNSGSSSDPYGVVAVNTASTNTLVISFISNAGTGTLTNAKNTITHKGTGTFHLVSGDANGDSGRYIGLSANHTANAGFGSIASTSANATASFEGATITAGASTTKMGAVITYQDNAGTNTLNTDIILKLSADNGSNYSTATLTALPDFATGIKMAKVNDLTVTAGTQLKYKLEFANQSFGSKEARIRGVSLQY